MTSLQFLVKSRGYIRASVARIYNERARLGECDSVEKSNKYLKLQNLMETLTESDKQISKLVFDDYTEEEFTKEMETCEGYQDRIREAMCILTGGFPEPPSQRTYSPNVPRSMLKSPNAPLPKFKSSEGENLDLFLYNFDETLSKFQYSDYDKLLLLKQQISGSASLLIETLEPDRQTYTEAKDLLRLGFATTTLQKFNVIKLPSEIKLDYSDEPFQFISNMRKIQQTIEQLHIEVSDVVQYFIS